MDNQLLHQMVWESLRAAYYSEMVINIQDVIEKELPDECLDVVVEYSRIVRDTIVYDGLAGSIDANYGIYSDERTTAFFQKYNDFQTYINEKKLRVDVSNFEITKKGRDASAAKKDKKCNWSKIGAIVCIISVIVAIIASDFIRSSLVRLFELIICVF